MSASRKRKPARAPTPPKPTRGELDQLEVDGDAAELLALWRIFPSALARDSSGTLAGGGRHASGAVDGSASPGNVSVMDAAALIETGLHDVAAQAVALLNLERERRDPLQIIAALPDWHRSLSARRQPLAEHIRRDLGAWLREARGAIGTRRHDRKLGPLCPEHRDDHPTPLLEVGDVAVLAPSLIAGAPLVERIATGPPCHEVLCSHLSCAAVRDRRLLDDRGRVLDWVAAPDGPVWASIDGDHALRWQRSSVIRCPRCRTEWASTTQRRILAQRLVELGDDRVDVAAAIA